MIYYIYNTLVDVGIEFAQKDFILSKENADFIAALIKNEKSFNESCDKIDKIFSDHKKLMLDFRKRRLKELLESHPILHPIKWWKRWEFDRTIEKLLQESRRDLETKEPTDSPS